MLSRTAFDTRRAPVYRTLKIMSEQHYFTNSPETAYKPKKIRVNLAGQSLSVTTANGIFSPGGIDKGTAVLLADAPEPQGTTMLDIGCGWGPITMTMAMLAPNATVYGVDVNERSRSLALMNAADNRLSNVRISAPEEVPADLRFDTIWSNPPIRVGKEVLHEILLTWLPRLAVGGVAYLVVQKNLGADSLLTWLDKALTEVDGQYKVSRYSTSKGFRLLEVARTA